MMKKRRSIAELIDGILEKRAADGRTEPEGAALGRDEDEAGDHLMRLGKAFLERLDIPDGMSEREAAERIIAMWSDADAMRAGADSEGLAGGEEPEYEADDEVEHDEKAEAELPISAEAPGERRGARLPAPIRGGLFEAPRADYESMSAEQFRRLKKQLERANRDGRRVRL